MEKKRINYHTIISIIGFVLIIVTFFIAYLTIYDAKIEKIIVQTEKLNYTNKTLDDVRGEVKELRINQDTLRMQNLKEHTIINRKIEVFEGIFKKKFYVDNISKKLGAKYENGG